MARDINDLKQAFQTGDKPTGQDFSDLIDLLHDTLTSIDAEPANVNIQGHIETVGNAHSLDLTPFATNDALTEAVAPLATLEIVNTAVATVSSNVSGANKFIFAAPQDFTAVGSTLAVGILQPVPVTGLSLAYQTGDFFDSCDALSFVDPSSLGTIDGNGDFKCGPAVAGSDLGTGSDGSINVTTSTNINSDVLASGRAYADGINYSVTALGTNFVDCISSPVGIVGGDKVLLINLQGVSSAVTNVGNYEVLTVQSINGLRMYFTSNKVKLYGNTNDENVGVAATNQRVMVQRIPQYQNVTISGAGNLTCTAWNGVTGGVVAMMVAGTLSLSGTIQANGTGYRSQSQMGGKNWGESYGGINIASEGAGGAGNGYPSGSGYGTAGTTGSQGATAGAAYGNATLTKLYFGSASSANDNGHSMIYSNGGGIVFVAANIFSHTGTLQSNAAAASQYVGGGAGGSIAVTAQTFNIGTNTTQAIGATGQNGCGNGGTGITAVMYGTISGSLAGAPTATLIVPTNVQTVSNIISTNIVAGKAATSFSTIALNMASIPYNGTATIQFSQDKASWSTAQGLIVGNNLIDVSHFGWTTSFFYYKVNFTSDGITSPLMNSVELTYAPVRFYTTDQQWTSKVLNNPGVTTFIPPSFLAVYSSIVGNAKPKFQLIGSNSSNMASPTVYPAVGQYYQEDTSHLIAAGTRMYLNTQITTPLKYWQVVAVLNAGTSYGTSPVVSRLELEYQ